MPININKLQTTDTFGVWFEITNDIVDALENVPTLTSNTFTSNNQGTFENSNNSLDRISAYREDIIKITDNVSFEQGGNTLSIYSSNGAILGTGFTLESSLLPAQISANTTGQAATVASLVNLDTDDLAEANNQYFTIARARDSVGGGVGIDYNSSTGVISANLQVFSTDELSEGSNQYFTPARARNATRANLKTFEVSSDGIISDFVENPGSSGRTDTSANVTINDLSVGSYAMLELRIQYADTDTGRCIVTNLDASNTNPDKILLSQEVGENIIESFNLYRIATFMSIIPSISASTLRIEITPSNPGQSWVYIKGSLKEFF